MATLLNATCPNCDAEFAVVEEPTQDIDELNCPLCLAEIGLDDEEEDEEEEDTE